MSSPVEGDRSGVPPRRAKPLSLVDGGRGLLVLEEDQRPLSRRLRRHGIPGSTAMHEALRGLVVGTPELPRYVAAAQLPLGVVRAMGGSGAPPGLLLGARVDRGAHPLPGRSGEMITLAPEALGERLAELTAAGGSFACWRAVFVINQTPGSMAPTSAVIDTNAGLMGLFAAASVRAGLVPLLALDVRRDGRHDARGWAATLIRLLEALFGALRDNHVLASQVVLAAGMATEGRGCRTRADPASVAAATVDALGVVPADLGGLTYICDGQPFSRLESNLAAIRRLHEPWPSGFTVGKAAIDTVMAAWRGDPAHTERARAALIGRVRRLWAAGTHPEDTRCPTPAGSSDSTAGVT